MFRHLISTTKALALAALLMSTREGLAEDFFVSQIRENENWCIVAKGKGPLGFGLCEKYFDVYPDEGEKQAFTLEEDGRVRSMYWEYDSLCMIVNNGVNIGGGLMNLDDCDIESDLNKFSYDGKNLKLASPNKEYCVTNRGTTPNESDTIHAKPCGPGGRFQYELEPARRYWQMLIYAECRGTSGNPCMMSEGGKTPSLGDKVVVDECTSDGGDGWMFEVPGIGPTLDLPDGAFLFHNKFNVDLCMQAGEGEAASDRDMMHFKPCDSTNDLQRFVATFSEEGNLYGYRIVLESQPNLCITFRGARCAQGDPMILKECSSVSLRRTFVFDYDENGSGPFFAFLVGHLD